MNKFETQDWTPVYQVGFRLLFCYLVLFFFPFPSDLVNPSWLGGIFDGPWQRIVPWISIKFLNIQVANVSNGSGDTTYAYLRILCMLVIAISAAVVWSIVDRRRGDYRTLYSCSRIWLRYALALCMLTFGAVKVLMVQFEPPSYGRLMQPLGQFSPMALLWVFMGFSHLYAFFTGLAEVIAGLLLFFRRTTTLGALIVVGVMMNVLMLNVSFDVPVKLGALHIILLALVLLAPELRRLMDFFILNRSTEPVDLGPNFVSKRLNWWSGAIKAALICSLLLYLALDTHSTYTQNVAKRSVNPTAPEGWYRIMSIKRDGGEIPAIALNEFRWRTFSLRDEFISLRSVDGSLRRFMVEGDPIQETVAFYPVNDKSERIEGSPATGSLMLTVSDDGQASLKGVFEGRDFEAAMQRENPDDFPLMNQGFRWISEAPYFR